MREEVLVVEVEVEVEVVRRLCLVAKETKEGSISIFNLCGKGREAWTGRNRFSPCSSVLAEMPMGFHSQQ